MATLIGLHYSPWTERARWALDHHGVAYRYREHVPFLGEPVLRWVTRGTGSKATVPVLRVDGRVIGDSIDIIAYADEVGSGAPLMAEEAEVRAWRERVDTVLGLARGRVTGRMLRDPGAMREAAMAVSPAAFAGLLSPVARRGAQFVADKHGADTADNAGVQEQRALLVHARDAIAEGGFVLGDSLSAADLLVATLLQSVRPVDAPHLELKPHTREAWTCAALEEEFDDLLAWRDALYADSRPAV